MQPFARQSLVKFLCCAITIISCGSALHSVAAARAPCMICGDGSMNMSEQQKDISALVLATAAQMVYGPNSEGSSFNISMLTSLWPTSDGGAAGITCGMVAWFVPTLIPRNDQVNARQFSLPLVLFAAVPRLLLILAGFVQKKRLIPTEMTFFPRSMLIYKKYQ
jgi:hypothetical protein